MDTFSNNPKLHICIWLSAVAIVLSVVSLSFASDIGNCLLCHKYPGLSRVDEQGKLRLLYINEDIFNNSVHAKVKCEGCHSDITKIPHDPAKKVDCLSDCHIKEPSSEQKFSHNDVSTSLSKSVHGKLDIDGKEKKYPEDLPSCKDCHDEPLYRPISFFKQARAGISESSLSRCKTCHKNNDFIYRFYNHVTSRMHRTRNPLNIAEACARCHDDPKLVQRHNLGTKAVFSYGETFHGKAAKFLDDRVPDCLDCHVNKGDPSHLMLQHTDPRSSIHENNRVKSGTMIDCHPRSSSKRAKYGVQD